MPNNSECLNCFEDSIGYELTDETIRFQTTFYERYSRSILVAGRKLNDESVLDNDAFLILCAAASNVVIQQLHFFDIPLFPILFCFINSFRQPNSILFHQLLKPSLLFTPLGPFPHIIALRASVKILGA